MALPAPKELAQIGTEGVGLSAPFEMAGKSVTTYVHPARRAFYKPWHGQLPALPPLPLDEQRPLGPPRLALTVSVTVKQLKDRKLLRIAGAPSDDGCYGSSRAVRSRPRGWPLSALYRHSADAISVTAMRRIHSLNQSLIRHSGRAVRGRNGETSCSHRPAPPRQSPVQHGMKQRQCRIRHLLVLSDHG
jgi:hypothetical protein